MLYVRWRMTRFEPEPGGVPLTVSTPSWTIWFIEAIAGMVRHLYAETALLHKRAERLDDRHPLDAVHQPLFRDDKARYACAGENTLALRRAALPVQQHVRPVRSGHDVRDGHGTRNLDHQRPIGPDTRLLEAHVVHFRWHPERADHCRVALRCHAQVNAAGTRRHKRRVRCKHLFGPGEAPRTLHTGHRVTSSHRTTPAETNSSRRRGDIWSR